MKRHLLQLYRCYVVWRDWRVLVFPLFLYFATFGMHHLIPSPSHVLNLTTSRLTALGIATSVVTGLPDSNFFEGASQSVALSYSTVVISLNCILSSLICGRLLFHARDIEHVLGRHTSQKYTGAVALLIEAALPYTLFGIAYVITLGVHSPTSILFMSIYVMFTVGVVFTTPADHSR